MISKRTAIIVTTGAAIGVLGDLITYSISAPPAGKISLVLPKGKDLLIFLSIGITAGIVVDQTIKLVENSIKNAEEKKLDELVNKEKEKSIEGVISEDLEPTDVVWIKN